MSEHESAVAAWLDSPETKRELAILHQRYPDWTPHQCVQIAMSMEILVSLNVYGADAADIFPPVDGPLPDPEDDDPWQTGWKPSQN